MDFNEIIANVERELAELKRINEELRKENILLKNGMNSSIEENKVSLSIEHVFYDVIYVGKKGMSRNLAYKALTEYGCVWMDDINEEKLTKIYKDGAMGVRSLAFVVTVLRHYSMNVKIPYSDLKINKNDFEAYIKSAEQSIKFMNN